MTEKKYWKKRCELAESVINGLEASDALDLIDGVMLRVNKHRDFVAKEKPSTKTYQELDLFERIDVSPGVTIMRAPGGYVLEYWIVRQNEKYINNSTFLPR